jgi:hypothetical protein
VISVDKSYKKRYKTELILSERQLEQMSAIHIADMFMQTNRLKDLENINPKWVETNKWKSFDIWYEEQLKKNGIWDNGRLVVRKTRKGYVLELKFKWVSKGLKKTKYTCNLCHKSDKLNFELLCEKCTKELKAKKKFSKFVYEGWRPEVKKDGRKGTKKASK